MSGTFIAQIISFALSPVLSRIYSPDDYAILALFLSLITILSTLSTGKYELGIVLPKEDKEAINLLSLVIFLCVIVSSVTIIIIVFFNSLITKLLANPGISYWLYFVPPVIFLYSVFQSLSYWANRKSKYKRLSFSKMFLSGTQSVFSLIWGLLKSSTAGLLFGNILGQLFSTIVIFVQSKKEIFALKKEVSFTGMKMAAKSHKDFPMYNLPTSLLDVFSAQLIIIMIPQFFSTTLTGHYSFAMRFLSLPLNLIAAAASQVFYQKFADVINKGQNAKPILIKLWKNLFLLGIVPAVILMIWGQEIFSFVFGNKWAVSGSIASILAPMVLAMFISTVTSSAYIVLRIQNYVLGFGIAVLLYRFLCIFLGYYLNDFLLGLKILVAFEILEILLYNVILYFKLGKKNTDRK